MIAAIMQPYFFPYIGYFQLMNAVDKFVFYDDAQYMKGGWINRNRVAIDSKIVWLTLPIRRASLMLPINERLYRLDSEDVDGIKRKLKAGYSRCPEYDENISFICRLLDFADRNVAAFNSNLLVATAKRLGIQCAFEFSSQIGNSRNLRGEERVIDLCKHIGAKRYVNAIGGQTLYDANRFTSVDIELSFLRTTTERTHFQDGPQHLSVLDDLFQRGPEQASRMLSDCELIKPEKLS